MNKCDNIQKPNFFILGAAKSGTTSLYHYLKSHPAIFLSDVKEPTFFCEDFQVIKNPIQYFELFEKATTEKYIGEASHGYLTDPKVAGVIKGLFPDSKFVLVFRNPADRAYSLYNHMRRHGYEKIHTFEKALEAEDARFKSLDFKKNNGQYFHNFLYYESGKYGEQIQRYMNLFDRNQFLFLSFEELSQNPTITLSKVCDFLEIPAFGFKSLIHSNKGYGIKYPLLDSFIRSKLISNKISYKLKLHTTLQSFNKMDIQPIKKETRMKLMKAYENDLALLFELTGLRIT